MSEQRLVFHPRHSLAFTTDFICNAVKIDDAGEALEAVCRILSCEAKVHASRDTSSQTLDQATYLVGWHDAIHSLRNFILARRDLHMDKNTHIHGVPMCMSFPLTATIPEAAFLVASRGTASVFNIPEVPLFSPSGAEKQADDGFIVVSSSSATPFNTPTTSSFLQNSSSAPTARDSQLQTSSILAGIDTKTILLNYEREARESEQRIATEMAKMSLMRQAIFKDRFFGEVPSLLDNGGFVNKQQQDRAVDAVNQIFRSWRAGQAPPTTRPSHALPAVRNLDLFGGALRNLQSNRPAVPQSPGNAGTCGGPSFLSSSQSNNTSQAGPRSQPSLFNYASMQSTPSRSQPNPTAAAPLLDRQLDQLLQDRNDTHDLKELWQSYQPGPSFIERNGVLLPPPDATPSAGSSKSVGSSGPPQTFGRRLGSCAISNGGQRQPRREARSSIFHIVGSPTPSTIPTSAQSTLSHAPRQQPASSASSTALSQDATEREMEAMYREGDRLLDLDATGATSDRSTRRSQAELPHQAARDLRARVRARRAREQAQTYTPEDSDPVMTAPSPSPTSSSTEPAELDAFGTELGPSAAAPAPPSRSSIFRNSLAPEHYNPAPVQSLKYNSSIPTTAGRGGVFGEALYNPAPARSNPTDSVSIPKAAAPAPGRVGNLFGESTRRPHGGGGLFGTSLAPSQQVPSSMFGSEVPYNTSTANSSPKSTEEKDDL
ncbi:hypothetical protein COL154_006908 [Colletotrichum chrysophilum]|uniref:uncharacterized protein n=1 Tax=Colletotrichum chrysophilum TaxID=1836956 RepID=UPI0023008BEF|nr:uncharacterized protein COL26b_004581 [Colletotrichum chrysophilum]KAJ0347878.1 hypothetical protein KNSL1_006034 [Colletotrichum chrysophilum]KAJ0361409.1 hypothetical protein COL154_006908 [Colletotrichum chrysophilum]KAJ0377142.1 hypothetical protein COL26b_004581 [Colletotrichum chrysophilum]